MHGRNATLAQGRIPSVMRLALDPLTLGTTTPPKQPSHPPRQPFDPPRNRRREAPRTRVPRRRLRRHGPLKPLDYGPYGAACAAGLAGWSAFRNYELWDIRGGCAVLGCCVVFLRHGVIEAERDSRGKWALRVCLVEGMAACNVLQSMVKNPG